MSEVPPGIDLLLSGLAGVALGLFFFGGLWLTVRALPRSRSPARLMLGSFLFRVSVTVAGFYFVMDGSWERVVACLGGFLVTRTILVTWCQPSSRTVLPSKTVLPKESVETWK